MHTGRQNRMYRQKLKHKAPGRQARGDASSPIHTHRNVAACCLLLLHLCFQQPSHLVYLNVQEEDLLAADVDEGMVIKRSLEMHCRPQVVNALQEQGALAQDALAEVTAADLHQLRGSATAHNVAYITRKYLQ